jgi:hypothetical protein
MFSLSIVHVLAVAVLILLVWAFVAIFGRIVNRAGYSRWWLLTLVVPVVNLIMVWVFAFAIWPVSNAGRHA